MSENLSIVNYQKISNNKPARRATPKVRQKNLIFGVQFITGRGGYFLSRVIMSMMKTIKLIRATTKDIEGFYYLTKALKISEIIIPKL